MRTTIAGFIAGAVSVLVFHQAALPASLGVTVWTHHSAIAGTREAK